MSSTSASAGLALLVCAGAVAGCGASAAEIKTARSAVYTCSIGEIAKQAADVLTERVAPLADLDPDRGNVVTRYRWHDAYGKRKAVEVDETHPGDVLVSVSVAIRADELGRHAITLESEVHGQLAWSPQAIPLPPGNADRPRWVAARDDELRVAIHKRLTHCLHQTAP